VVGNHISDILFLVPSNLLVGNGSIWVTLANRTEDSFSVKLWGARAGTPLEVVGEAAGRGVVGLAKGAGDIGSAVNL
jgi:hypothetical protein